MTEEKKLKNLVNDKIKEVLPTITNEVNSQTSSLVTDTFDTIKKHKKLIIFGGVAFILWKKFSLFIKRTLFNLGIIGCFLAAISLVSLTIYAFITCKLPLTSMEIQWTSAQVLLVLIFEALLLIILEYTFECLSEQRKYLYIKN